MHPMTVPLVLVCTAVMTVAQPAPTAQWTFDNAADLLSDSAGLVHDNEPRWRRFHQRVLSISRPAQPPRL